MLEWRYGARCYKFAAPLRRAMAGLFDVSDDEVEDLKRDEVAPGRSGREVMIAISEKVCKPLLGGSWFGRIAGETIRRELPDIAVVTDSGFASEVNACVCACDPVGYQPELWAIMRGGHTFDGDSRSYLAPGGMPRRSLINNGSMCDLYKDVVRLFEGAP
jgi:hypothetical protein